jgi:hypothetical protein
MSGSGAGNLLLSSGTLNASPVVNLAFDGDFFQWTGGTLSGLATNVGSIVLSGAGGRFLSGDLYNLKLVRQSGLGGSFGLNSGAVFHNVPSGIYQIEADGQIYVSTCCSGATFENQGLIHQVSATNFNISTRLSNLGGTIQVDAGTLTLQNNGSSSNGTFKVALGAAVNLTGGSTPTWAGRMDGSGAGKVLLTSGRVLANPSLILNFAPEVFNWGGDGTFSGTITNINNVRIPSGNAYVDGVFGNRGVVSANASTLGLTSGSDFYNLAGGEFRMEGDAGAYTASCCSGSDFVNLGLLHKTAGVVSSISTRFANQNGSIQVDAGTLDLGANAYVQGTGSLSVRLSSTNSALLKAGAVTLSGPLHITLADGYVPSTGTEFPILQGSSIAGTFSTVDLPSGLSVDYRGNTVVIVVTGQILTGESVPLIRDFSIKVSAAGLVSLEWPESPEAILESAPALQPGAEWNPVKTANGLSTGGISRINLPVTNRVLFFRLRQSAPAGR